MNLTIPIRAQNSTGSWFRQLRGSSSMKTMKAHRKRYVFSMITATLLVGSIVAGSVGGMSQVAAARDNFPSPTMWYPPGSNQNQGASNPNQNPSTGNNDTSPTGPTSPTTTEPGTSQTTTPPTSTSTPPTTSTTPASQTTATAPSASTPPATEKEVIPQLVTQPIMPVDTTPAIANMTAAQAAKDTQAVRYTSGLLSDDARNHIFVLASITAAVGVLLYVISFIGSSASGTSKPEIPVRYIVPVKEV